MLLKVFIASYATKGWFELPFVVGGVSAGTKTQGLIIGVFLN